LNLLDVMLNYPDILLSRDSVIDLFVESEFSTKQAAEDSDILRIGKVYLEGNAAYVVNMVKDGKITESTRLDDITKLSISDEMTIVKGMIANYTSDQPLITTIGRYLLNYVILVEPFGDTIPYINDRPWNIGKVEKMIVNGVIAGKIPVPMVYRYVDNAYHISSYNDFFVPALSEKAITSNDEVSKYREVLLKKHADQLHNPSVMAKIEDELIAMDKKLLEGDVSNGFMMKSKNYNVHRKRMFLALGMMETFGDNSSGFDFGTTNLNDGWKLDELPLIANDTRRGSYRRGKETAKGGTESKFIGRNFQDSKINTDDCGDTRGLSLYLTDYNKHHFLSRTIIDKGKLTLLTSDNIDSYVGKTVKLRSPMYCQAKNGYCYTCMDSRFRDIGLKRLNISPINISSTILNISMKSMHGTKIEIHRLDDLNMFIV